MNKIRSFLVQASILVILCQSSFLDLNANPSLGNLQYCSAIGDIEFSDQEFRYAGQQSNQIVDQEIFTGSNNQLAFITLQNNTVLIYNLTQTGKYGFTKLCQIDAWAKLVNSGNLGISSLKNGSYNQIVALNNEQSFFFFELDFESPCQDAEIFAVYNSIQFLSPQNQLSLFNADGNSYFTIAQSQNVQVLSLNKEENVTKISQIGIQNTSQYSATLFYAQDQPLALVTFYSDAAEQMASSLYSLQNPSSPELIQVYPNTGYISQYTVYQQGNQTFAIPFTMQSPGVGFEIYNITNLENPVLISSISGSVIDQIPPKIYVVGAVAYAATILLDLTTQEVYIYLIDISNPGRPNLFQSILQVSQSSPDIFININANLQQFSLLQNINKDRLQFDTLQVNCASCISGYQLINGICQNSREDFLQQILKKGIESIHKVFKDLNNML